jgi:hypothetical protein
MAAGVPHSCVRGRQALPRPKTTQRLSAVLTLDLSMRIAPEEHQAHHLVMLDILQTATGSPFIAIVPQQRDTDMQHSILPLRPIAHLHQINVPGAISSALSWTPKVRKWRYALLRICRIHPLR